VLEIVLLFYWRNKMDELEIFEKLSMAKKKYTQQQYAAKQRNIEWLYTFETWWKQWQESGKWEQRGNKRNQYCMGRKGDIGPYSPDNVDIILATKNSSDAKLGKVGWNKGQSLSEEHKEKLRQAHIGMQQSEETKLKKSLANRGRPWSEARRAAHRQAWNKGLTRDTDPRVAAYADNYPENRKSKID